ncbi:hypothetical protein ACIQHU_12570 [Streptomyces tendae]|uniref:hypothetical protein n=1 Tax=Streptomyces tendae TaxID=1932 RepID=UPI003814F9A7
MTPSGTGRGVDGRFEAAAEEPFEPLPGRQLPTLVEIPRIVDAADPPRTDGGRRQATG